MPADGPGWPCRVGAAAERFEGRPGPVEVPGLVQVEWRALASSQMAAQLVVGVGQLPGHGEPLGLPDGPRPGPAGGAMAALEPVRLTQADQRPRPGHGEGAGVAPQPAQVGGGGRAQLGRVHAGGLAPLQQGQADLGEAGVGFQGIGGE
jgi:hypothetical protein